MLENDFLVVIQMKFKIQIRRQVEKSIAQLDQSSFENLKKKKKKKKIDINFDQFELFN